MYFTNSQQRAEQKQRRPQGWELLETRIHKGQPDEQPPANWGSLGLRSCPHPTWSGVWAGDSVQLTGPEHTTAAPTFKAGQNLPHFIGKETDLERGRQLAHSDKWAGDPHKQKLSDFGRALSEALWSFCRPGPAQNTVGAQEIPAKVTAQM